MTNKDKLAKRMLAEIEALQKQIVDEDLLDLQESVKHATTFKLYKELKESIPLVGRIYKSKHAIEFICMQDVVIDASMDTQYGPNAEDHCVFVNMIIVTDTAIDYVTKVSAATALSIALNEGDYDETTPAEYQEQFKQTMHFISSIDIKDADVKYARMLRMLELNLTINKTMNALITDYCK